MPCFYCGKPISLMRRLADADFCSEDHRQKYHELTRMALNRLVETRDHLEAAAPKRKRPRAAVPAEAPTPAPPAELLPERVAAVPIVGQMSLAGEHTPAAHTLQLPATRAGASNRVGSGAQWAPVIGPRAIRASGTPPAWGTAPRGFVAFAAHGKPSWSQLGLAVSLRGAGLPAPSAVAPRELQAAGLDGRARPAHEIRASAGALCLPTGRLDPAAGTCASATTTCALPIPGAHPPPPARWYAPAGVEAAAALTQFPSGTLGPRPPSAQAPAVKGRLPGATPWPSPAAPAQSVRVPPASFGARDPALPAQRFSSSVGWQATAASGPLPACAPPGPAGCPATAVLAPAAFQPAGPRLCTWNIVQRASGLAVGASAPVGSGLPRQRPAVTVVERLPGVLAAGGDIRWSHASIWRLQPVKLDLYALTIPPAVTGWFPVRPPQPQATGQAVSAATSEPWPQSAPKLAPVGREVEQARLESAPLVRLTARAGQARSEPRMARTALAPEFPIARQSYIGWGATSLRRALWSAAPAAIEVGEIPAGRPIPRETTPPGFRVAAWAFTHAPGLARGTAVREGALLAGSAPDPLDMAARRAGCVGRPPAAPTLPVLPRWQAKLLEDALAAAAAEPPEAGWVSLTALAPQGGRKASPSQLEMWMPAPRTVWPAELSGQALPAPSLGSCGAPGSTAEPRYRSGVKDLHELPALGFGARLRLMESRPTGAAGLAVVSLIAGSRALATVLHGPAAGPPPPLGWETRADAPASFEAARPDLPSVVWAPFGHWKTSPPNAPAGGSGSLKAAPGAMSPVGMVWPPATGMVEHPLIRCAPPSPRAALPPRDDAAARSRRPGAAAPLTPPSAVTGPTRTFALPACSLPEYRPAPGAVRSRDVRATLAPPAPPPRAPSAVALPAGRGVPECAADLFCPQAAAVEPPARDQRHAVWNSSRLEPMRPSMRYQTRPLAPIPHRFERLPAEADFVPALGMARFWRRIPRRVVIAVAAPTLLVVLGMLLWSPAREALRGRAAVTVEDYFSAGMERWTGTVGDWTRDPAGFAVVGSLAFLGPSMRLSDYRLEFQAQIERESLGWAFRAADAENFYAMKIVVLKAGALPTLGLMRYRVTGGQQTTPVEVPLRILLHNEATFRVQMRVSGNDFSTFVNHQQVDFWSDDRLAAGGIGFFCEKGGRARLYWVKVSHQDDLVGKLCSFFAPNDLSRNGSWK